ncbi:unnamed protein product [Rotaria sp. Silwood1]|nr:unnamed protein product [Rotaria sp. Silwood1]CAF3349196.1 unnamed protein product [Rotaria sp. Silwood1]CAF4597275.1 unnamed protein product [Rotaria sp. Silwood1]
MHRHNQNNDYRNYSFIPPSSSSSSRNAHYQYYDRRLRTRQTLYSNATPIPTYSTPRPQHQYQPSSTTTTTTTTISDLAEPISVFHNIEPSKYHRSSITSLPITYKPPNPSRQSSIVDNRLATASVMREHLLKDIQRNISEIDQELSSLKKRPSISQYIPPRLSPIVDVRQTSSQKKTPLPNDDKQIWPDKPKRVYQVVPRITSEAKKTSQQSTPKLSEQSISNSFIGQYHYGPEVEEIEIRENDPENSDLKSTSDEISRFNFHEIFSLEQFYRQQSDLPENRALIFVPQYVDNYDIKINESTEEFQEKTPIDTNFARSSTVTSLHDLASSNKLNIQDFQLLMQIAPEPKIEISSENVVNSHEISNQVEENLNNTILSKPVKHSRLSIRTQETLSLSSQTMKNAENTTDFDMNYFFSDFGNEYEGEEDLISIDPYHFAPPTASEIIPDDNKSNILIRQSQTSLPNSHASEQQQTIENNNQYIKETEKKKIDATTEHIVTPISTSQSTKMLPVSIDDDTQTQSVRNNNNSNEHQRQIFTTSLNMNTNEQSQENKLNNLLTDLHASSSKFEQETTNKTTSKNISPTHSRPRSISNKSHSSRQRSSSLHNSTKNPSKNILSQEQSFTSIPNISEISTKQTEPVLDNEQQTSNESRRSSAIPVVLYSPDSDNIPVSTSRTASPERRNSIPSLNQNILFTSTDIINFEDSNTENLQTVSSQQPNVVEHEELSHSINSLSVQEIQQNNQSHELQDELLSNENQDEIINQHLSPPISIHEQENNRLKSVSPLTMETKKIEDNDNNDDLHLPSLSPRHCNGSNTNLTSVEQEDIFRQTISPDYINNQLEKPTSPLLEPKLIVEDQSKHEDKHSSSPILEDESLPLITASQRRSKLSLLVHRPKQRQKKPIHDQLVQTHIKDSSTTNTNQKSKKQEHHVSNFDNISHVQIKENHPLKNWRERIHGILTKKHLPNDKYSHVKSRVNSFGNFEYQSKRFVIFPKKKLHKKILSDQQIVRQEDKFKNNKNQSEENIPSSLSPQLFGRLWCLPDGKPKIFHEPLRWNVQSKIKSYSLENLHHKPHQSHFKVFNEKPKWNSESKLAEIVKISPRRQILMKTVTLLTMPEDNDPYIHQQESQIETKIFDINSNGKPQYYVDDIFFDSKQSTKLIIHKKLSWKKQSKLKNMIWENKDYQPKQSQVKIFHQAVRWKNESKLQITHLINWNNQEKIKYWSKIDQPQLTKTKALFSAYYDPKWNDIITDNIDTTNKYDPLIEKLKLNDHEEENLQNEIQVQSPANRPKWNSVSKTRSVNLIYNPKISNSNSIRRGWDLELRRKRVHKLPPIKRKRDHNKLPQLSVEGPSSNYPLAIDYNYDPCSTANEHMTSIDYGTISSRPSTKALVPLRHIPNLELLSETPRSQRPIQQEWYDELNKSRLTHRTDMGRITNNSFRDSIGSIHQTNTPRELLTLRSSTRNSQNSVMSGTLLDSSIRTNRATELRLSRDMNEYHQHSHDPSQSMPMEIRGFRLEGTQLTVPDDATIRPLSNINYRASEHVKHRRIFPWSSLHQHGTSSRNSSLLPIAEYRHPSFQTSIIEVPQLVQEE